MRRCTETIDFLDVKKIRGNDYSSIFRRMNKNPNPYWPDMKTPPMSLERYRSFRGLSFQLYHYLFNIIDEEGYCAPTNQNIQRHTGIVVVETQIKKLTNMGLIEIVWFNSEHITDKHISPYLYFLPCVYR